MTADDAQPTNITNDSSEAVSDIGPALRRATAETAFDELFRACRVAITELEQAIEVYRMLVEATPAAFRPRLGQALVNLAGIVMATGQAERAHRLLVDGVEVWRAAAAEHPQHAVHLAESLAGLVRVLTTMARHDQALAAAQQAVGAWRTAAEASPPRDVDLAKSLLTLSSCLARVGQHADALAAGQEAVSIARRGAGDGRPAPDHFVVTQALLAVAERLESLGRYGEAATAARQAVENQQNPPQGPAADDPAVMAALLSTQGRILMRAGEHTEALGASATAVQIFRQLAANHREAYELNLAKALVNMSLAAAHLDDRPGALGGSDEAVTILRRLADVEPGRFEPDLAVALQAYVDVRGTVLVTTEDLVDAVRALAELTTLYERLNQLDDVRFGAEARAARRHAAGFMQALAGDPRHQPVLGSPEAEQLRRMIASLGPRTTPTANNMARPAEPGPP
jgi:tetratricopeptide (TPR) repeat protein